MNMNEPLTSKNYWESYYKDSHTAKEHIVKVCSYYDRFWTLFFGPNALHKECIEIGGFPGRYLAYVASKYKIKPTCLDYNSDKKQIEDAFKVMHVDEYEIIQDDFFKYKPNRHYDYVFSNGFIEHFETYDEVLDLHVNYVKKGGKLLIMIPNMKGYIRWYKYMVDYNNLKIHNLKSMSLDVFEAFAKRNDLRIDYLSYLGEFPHNPHQKGNVLQEFWVKAHRTLFKKGVNKWVNTYPSRYFSSTILGIFEKN